LLTQMERRGAIGLAIVSAIAGVIHLAVIGEHWREHWVLGVFFLGVGVLQLAWAGAAFILPNWLALPAAAGNALVAGIWVVSRTIGFPFGPHGGEAEAVGALDLLASTCEVLLVSGVAVFYSRQADGGPVSSGAELSLEPGGAWVVRPSSRERTRSRRQQAFTWVAAALALATVALALDFLLGAPRLALRTRAHTEASVAAAHQDSEEHLASDPHEEAQEEAEDESDEGADVVIQAPQGGTGVRAEAGQHLLTSLAAAIVWPGDRHMGCKNLIERGWEGACGSETMAGGRVIWVVQHLNGDVASGPVVVRIFTYLEVAGGWVPRLQGEPSHETVWSSVEVLGKDITGDGEPELVLGVHLPQLTDAVSYDVVAREPGMEPRVETHGLAEIHGRVVLRSKGIDEYSGIGPADPTCCPLSFERRTIKWTGDVFEVVTTKTIDVDAAPTSDL
jgi:hypothetical protein